MRRILLFAIAFCCVKAGRAQFEEYLQPLHAEDILYNTTHKIASVTETEENGTKKSSRIKKYNTAGLLTYQSSAGGKIVAHYTYDKKNRLIAVADSNYDPVFDKWFTNRYEYKYHDNGLLKERTTNATTIRYEYSKKENKLTAKLPSGFDDGTVTEYYYNTNLQLVKETETGPNGEKTILLTYNTQNLPEKKVQITNYIEGYDSITTVYTYNAKGKLFTETIRQTSAFPVYDEDGNTVEGQMEKTESTSKWEYVYNDKGQIQTITHTVNNQAPAARYEEYTSTATAEGETVLLKIYKDGELVTEETIFYPGTKGLAEKRIRRENIQAGGHEQTKTVTYTYTFY